MKPSHFKPNIFLILIVLLSFAFNANSQTYMDVITEKSCACLNSISDTLPTDQLHLKLGICMLEAAEPYKKQLKTDYAIDLDKSDDSGERLGRMVGLKMAVKCPAALMKMANKADEVTSDEKVIKGTITKIDAEQFVVFSVKDEFGRISKYYWMTFIESAVELTGRYQAFTGKTVEITYRNQDFFDPKIEEYRPVSVILKMDIRD